MSNKRIELNVFVGAMMVLASPMSRADYNALRGWTVPEDENPTDEGYLVERLDGGTPNHPDFSGYISWSPKAQFESAYRPTTGLTFGLAIEALKKGKRVARAGWNGKGMWLVFVAYSCANEPENMPHYHHHAIDDVEGLPWIGMRTADNKFVPWLASQTDMLAEDWAIVD